MLHALASWALGSWDEGTPRTRPIRSPVRASLRVTVRQAVFLAAAQAFSREVRLLPRAPGDDRRGAAGLVVGADLAP